MLIRYNRLVTFPLQLFPSFHPLMKYLALAGWIKRAAAAAVAGSARSQT
jgi:hypothetical protein